MNNDLAFLFDLDGVIIDTEPQFDVLWRNMGERYHLGIPDFEYKIKGTITPDIINIFFSQFPQDEKEKIRKEIADCEQNMIIDFIPGAYEFLVKTKEAGIKTALVTSSNNEKLAANFKNAPVDLYPFFDTIVSADRITKGKPHPMPYLLAASDLNRAPENCVVFEDSFNGIKSGNAAGMRVVGLSTTNSKESIEKDVFRVVPDFRELISDEMFGRFIENVLK
jgi:haloacid dehalogenase superfamily, subfamily IA, variant 3 with third motif having DD or ED